MALQRCTAQERVETTLVIGSSHRRDTASSYLRLAPVITTNFVLFLSVPAPLLATQVEWEDELPMFDFAVRLPFMYLHRWAGTGLSGGK